MSPGVPKSGLSWPRPAARPGEQWGCGAEATSEGSGEAGAPGPAPAADRGPLSHQPAVSPQEAQLSPTRVLQHPAHPAPGVALLRPEQDSWQMGGLRQRGPKAQAQEGASWVSGTSRRGGAAAPWSRTPSVTVGQRSPPVPVRPPHLAPLRVLQDTAQTLPPAQPRALHGGLTLSSGLSPVPISPGTFVGGRMASRGS